MAAGEFLGEQARHDRRGGRGDDRIGGRVPVKLGEDGALGLDSLRHVLLDEARAVERGGEISRDAHPGGGPGRIVGQSLLGERVQPLPDRCQPGFSDARHGIVERHVPAGAREHHGPGATDEPRPDRRHFRHCPILLRPGSPV